MSPVVIPIHVDESCAGRAPLPEQPPELSGDAACVRRLVQALHDQVQPQLGGGLPVGAWLRVLRLDDGEAEVSLAAELGCRSVLVASLVFDVLRAQLPDTDIYVRAEGH